VKGGEGRKEGKRERHFLFTEPEERVQSSSVTNLHPSNLLFCSGFYKEHVSSVRKLIGRSSDDLILIFGSRGNVYLYLRRWSELEVDHSPAPAHVKNMWGPITHPPPICRHGNILRYRDYCSLWYCPCHDIQSELEGLSNTAGIDVLCFGFFSY
jgi:hypothetical protein